MATRFNQNIVDAAQRLKDNRTNPAPAFDAGMRYTSDRLVTYQNRAIRDVIKDVFEKFGRDGFAKVLPQMVKQSASLTVASPGVFTSPTDLWTFLELVSGSVIVKRIEEDILKISNGLDPLVLPTLTAPVYYESGATVVTVPALATVNGRYVFTHQTMTISDAQDIYLPPSFDGEIVDRMVQAALLDTYKETPKQ